MKRNPILSSDTTLSEAEELILRQYQLISTSVFELYPDIEKICKGQEQAAKRTKKSMQLIEKDVHKLKNMLVDYRNIASFEQIDIDKNLISETRKSLHTIQSELAKTKSMLIDFMKIRKDSRTTRNYI